MARMKPETDPTKAVAFLRHLMNRPNLSPGDPWRANLECIGRDSLELRAGPGILGASGDSA